MTSNTSKLVFIVAGEDSGDILGGRLMKALQDQSSRPIRFVGIGGTTMIRQGLESLFPMHDLSVMGLAEILVHLPRLLRRLRQTKEAVLTLKPDVIVTIDAPDFCLGLAKRVRKIGIPHIHYTPPTVWAWRPKRAKKIAKLIDCLLAIYPFEPPYFEKEGLPCVFVGHTVKEAGIEKIRRNQFREAWALKPDVPLLCVLPGSRMSEVKRLLPVFEQTIVLLKKQQPCLRLVVPVAPFVKEQVVKCIKEWDISVIFVENENDRYAAMRSSTAALAASGTVNLELALAQTPFVIAYKVNTLTAWFAKKLLKIPYVAMVNILSQKEVVPELLQENCTAEKLASALNKLLSDPAVRKAQVAEFKKVTDTLWVEGTPPSQKAAEAILRMINSS